MEVQKPTRLNNRYTIEVATPLLRPGLSIHTEVSERYVVPVTLKLMSMLREINATENEKIEQK